MPLLNWTGASTRFSPRPRQGVHVFRNVHPLLRGRELDSGTPRLIGHPLRSLWGFRSTARSNRIRHQPDGASPQGIAIRFHLADHVHTDIIGHSINAFPARTEKSSSNSCVRSSRADRTREDRAERCRRPSWNSLKLTRGEGIRPYAETDPNGAMPGKRTSPSPPSNSSTRPAKAGSADFVSGPKRTEFLTPEQAQKKTSDFLAAELSARLTRGPAVFRVLVQLAEPGDNVTDSTPIWPETRTKAEFGILTIKERVDELAPRRGR